MRIFYFLMLFATCAQYTKADVWDSMTYKEAKDVVQELKNNPYIFGSCDCCISSNTDAPAVEFLKVKRAEIISCDWIDSLFSVRIYGVVLAEIFYSNNNPELSQISKPIGRQFSQLLYMNYTFAFHDNKKMATPFYKIVDYSKTISDKKPCNDSILFPTPEQLKSVSKDKNYKKWFNKTM